MSVDIKDFAVKIKVGEICGTGVLYVPRQCGKFAYILTVCHIFEETDQEFDISVFFNLGLDTNNVNKKNYKCRFVGLATTQEIGKEVCRVCALPGYRFNQDSPNDGAVIEVFYESWMGDTRFEIRNVQEGKSLEGWGYPQTMKVIDKFCCKIDTVANDSRGRNEEEKDASKDYIVSYDVDMYKEFTSFDTEFLHGTSGTGLFLEDSDTTLLVALISRDASNNASIARLYLTDAVRLKEIVCSMISPDPGIFPTVWYIPFDNIKGKNPEKDKKPMDYVLDKVCENKADFFRIIYGDMWSGKSYSVGKWVNERSAKLIKGWNEVLEHLNNEKFSDDKESIFVLDDLERRFSEEEKKRLYTCQDSKDVKEGHLTADEKKCLIQKIVDNDGKCRRCGVTILVLCRSYFFRDAMEDMDTDLKNMIQKRIIICSDIDSSKMEEIKNSYMHLRIPEYFFQIPFVKRQLQWLVFLEQNREMLPEPEEPQMRYEYRLYKKVASNIDQNNLFDPTVSFERLENSSMEKQLSKYLIEFLRKGYNPIVEWDVSFSDLFGVYPFKKGEGILNNEKFKMADDVLYSYLFAEELFNLVVNERIEVFQSCIFNIYHIHMDFRDEKEIRDIGFRIRAFFQFLCEKEPDVKQQALGFLKEDIHRKCREWLFKEDDNVLERYHESINGIEDIDLNQIDFILKFESEIRSLIVELAGTKDLKLDKQIYQEIIRMFKGYIYEYVKIDNEKAKTLKYD